MRSGRVAVRGKLQSAETQQFGALIDMAGFAVKDPGNIMSNPRLDPRDIAQPRRGDERLPTFIGVPGIGGEPPFAGRKALDQAGFDPVSMEREFFPDFRACRELPKPSQSSTCSCAAA